MTEDLNLKQKQFCELYTAKDRDFFGNGVNCYVEAYNVDQSQPSWYKSSAASASRLLKKVSVLEEINNNLEAQDLNDGFVDKQLRFLITQHANFNVKLGAIGEYNKLKARIIKKLDHTTKGEPIKGFNYLTPNDDTDNKTDK